MLHTIWYDAKEDVIFQSGYLEGLFCALAFHPDFFKNNPHLDIIGLI